MALRPDTKQHLHFGVNFILAPFAAMTAPEQLQFQSVLADPVNGIVFDGVQRMQETIVFARQSEPLQVTIGAVGPQVGQLLIIAQPPARQLDDFVQEAQAVLSAFRAVRPGPVQLVRRDVTIRHLYAVHEQHAFLFLWERRLHQTVDSMDKFGRPILGGGVRFVMPPREGVSDDPIVEVKIESLLADPRQLFVEASFVWETPVANPDLDPKSLLSAVEQYLENEVQSFIQAE